MQTATSSRHISIPLGKLELPGILSIPDRATSIVIFAHGSGSSRFSTRNNYVAEVLQHRGFATLLFDLLTEQEDQHRQNRFDIDLLTERLEQVTEFVTTYPDTKNFAIGYFGASTGAASALRAAAILENKIEAVVSRGGRPDLAMDHLALVKAPTLLIVGSLDELVTEWNQEALERLKSTKELSIIDGASHLFSEVGKLEKVAWSAVEWFERHLSKIEKFYEY